MQASLAPAEKLPQPPEDIVGGGNGSIPACTVTADAHKEADAKDVDAITLSSLRLNQLGQASEAMVRGAVVASLLANTGFKLALTIFVGDRRLALRCAWPMAATATGLLVGLALA